VSAGPEAREEYGECDRLDDQQREREKDQSRAAGSDSEVLLCAAACSRRTPSVFERKCEDEALAFITQTTLIRGAAAIHSCS
jgi:hypothetical protein